MEDRTKDLGFKAQKETVYNKFLPYSKQIDEESTKQLAEIKANLALAVQKRDIKISVIHWTGQLKKYIRLHGHKFSKEDHKVFVDLLFELVCIPDLNYALVAKFSGILTQLLKKKELLSREDLVLPWRPLHQLLKNVTYSKYEVHGLVLFPQDIENVLKRLIAACRLYFSKESTQEMLDEWRPLMCPYDVTMMEAMYFFELFLPTQLKPEEQDQGFQLWFDEFYELWDATTNSPSWEKNVKNLFSRLAHDTIGQINWNTRAPKIFTVILRSMSLPVGSAKVYISRGGNNVDVHNICQWIISMMGGPDNVILDHLDNFWKATESFYHPSNNGRYSHVLLKFMQLICKQLLDRVYHERYKKPSWITPVPESHKISDDEITRFVKSVVPILLVAMFSKGRIMESRNAFQYLAQLRPELVIPPLLERTYPALETLTEPHRLEACLHCLTAVSRPLLVNTRWYPEGRSHVLPLLNLCLPGLDPNDIKKTMGTFQLMSTFTNLIPIVDCSEAIHTLTDLTEEERELCSATAQFEAFVCQFLDRVFVLIDNSAQDHVRAETTGTVTLNPLEQVLEMGLMSTFNSIVYQSSQAIYDEILRRLFLFVSTSMYEYHKAGRLTGHLIKAVTKTDANKSLKTFMKHFCDILLNRFADESMAKVEHLDHEILWNLKLLSALVQAEGSALLEYIPDIRRVLDCTLHVTCKDGAILASQLLEHTLQALTMTYANDVTNSPYNWTQPITERLPIREWGKACDLDELELRWHFPSQAEKHAAVELLSHILLPELARLQVHMAGGEQVLEREALRMRLQVVHHCLVGAVTALPMWQEDQLKLVESETKLTRYDHVTSPTDDVITLQGQNVRRLVSDTIRPLLAHMMANGEDDTKSLNQLTKIYMQLMLCNGSRRNDLDTRWKALQSVKKSMEYKLSGKKKHMRALLVERIQLQHELRVVNRAAKYFTPLHKDFFMDLFTLATSRYSEVRKVGQQVLCKGLHVFAYSNRVLLDNLVTYLKNDDSIEHHQYKGALYVVMGDGKQCILVKHSWDVMRRLWPALLKGQHSEKPSIIKLLDLILVKLYKVIDTPDIAITAHDRLLEVANRVWTEGNVPLPSLPSASETEIQQGLQTETARNATNLRMYNELVEEVVVSCNSGELNWKHYQMALEMLKLMTRHDVTTPACAVELFVNNMVHVTLNIRKIAISVVSAILKAQKRAHVTEEYDPYAVTNTQRPGSYKEILPGVRPDNKWLLYDETDRLDSAEKYDTALTVEKTHWGYYVWPKKMERYAPLSKQPPLGRSAEQMSKGEWAIYEKFTDETFVTKLMEYLALEENKGKDKFHSSYFTLFKGLLRNYDSALLPLLRPHVERLVNETAREKHEYSHRLAAELIAALIRGSKHWDFARVSGMWEWLTPLIKTGLSNMSVECIHDWGTAFATASESRDPRKLYFMFDILTDDPIRGEGGSFGDESRLYVLQGALAQQEWRVPTIHSRMLAYLTPHFAHIYKSVRDRLGSFLVTSTMCDPSLEAIFLKGAQPMLEPLKESASSNGAGHNGKHSDMKVDTGANTQVHSPMDTSQAGAKEQAMSNGQEGENGESEERKTAIRLCKTVMKYLQGSFTRNINCLSEEVFQLLPVLFCVTRDAEFTDTELEEERKLTLKEFYEVPLTQSHMCLGIFTELCAIQNELKDEELKQGAVISLAFVSHSLMKPTEIQLLFKTMHEVSCMRSWHARAAVLHFLQVLVFSNLFLMQDAATKQQIQSLISTLLTDEQLEVRHTAADTLGGLLQCGYLSVTPALIDKFTRLASTKVKSKKRNTAAFPKEPVNPERVIQRHAGVLGLCACVQAFPYDVPEAVPQILMTLSVHLDDPQPIQMTVKKTLANFKHTHYDNWHDHKQKFTDDQLVVLTDLLVSPSYYA